MALAKEKTVKKERTLVWTPVGRFSYPFFVTPDSGRQYSDDKYKSDLLIPKPVFKEHGKELQDAVLQVGRDHFGTKFDLKSGKWRIPFKDTDKDDTVVEAFKNSILIRAKSKRRPQFVGPRKINDKFPDLTEAEIAAIAGGHWGTLYVSIFAYDQKGGGVTLGLNAVQYWKADEAFGQGRSRMLETISELEAEIDEATAEDVDSSDEEEDSDSIV